MEVRVEAPYASKLGEKKIVDGWPVVFVARGLGADIFYQTYVQNYTKRSARPWKIDGRSFAKLENALRHYGTLAVDRCPTSL